MAANLTPQYQKAELQYRRAQTADEQVQCLTLMLQLIPRHKGTEKLQADLKSRLREARLQVQREIAQARSQSPFRFVRQGAGRIVLVGGPNSGKSLLLKTLTRAEPVVSPWPFTTREPLPGMMLWNDVAIQLIDTPPVVAGSIEPWFLNLVRSSDGVLLVADGSSDSGFDEAQTVCDEFFLRQTRFATSTGFDEQDLSLRNIQTLVVRTHAADPDFALRCDLSAELPVSALPNVSVELSWPDAGESTHPADELRRAVFEMLRVIRVYTRRPGASEHAPDPIALPAGGTVEQLALELHEDLFRNLRHARVWGAHVHDGQTVGRHFELSDGDIVELF